MVKQHTVGLEREHSSVLASKSENSEKHYHPQNQGHGKDFLGTGSDREQGFPENTFKLSRQLHSMLQHSHTWSPASLWILQASFVSTEQDFTQGNVC